MCSSHIHCLCCFEGCLLKLKLPLCLTGHQFNHDIRIHPCHSVSRVGRRHGPSFVQSPVISKVIMLNRFVIVLSSCMHQAFHDTGVHIHVNCAGQAAMVTLPTSGLQGRFWQKRAAAGALKRQVCESCLIKAYLHRRVLWRTFDTA